jgi:hypothetical protein
MGCVTKFGWKPWRRDHFEDLGIDGRIILVWYLKEIVWEDGEGRDQWCILVNMVLDLCVI